MRDYAELPALKHIYLEDSFVLAVDEDVAGLRFRLEAALTEEHPLWAPPQAGEANHYLAVDLLFACPRRVDWLERKMQPIIGPDGEVDYGNIDSFTWETAYFELMGEWGHVRIESDPPEVVAR